MQPHSPDSSFTSRQTCTGWATSEPPFLTALQQSPDHHQQVKRSDWRTSQSALQRILNRQGQGTSPRSFSIATTTLSLFLWTCKMPENTKKMCCAPRCYLYSRVLQPVTDCCDLIDTDNSCLKRHNNSVFFWCPGHRTHFVSNRYQCNYCKFPNEFNHASANILLF